MDDLVILWLKIKLQSINNGSTDVDIVAETCHRVVEGDINSINQHQVSKEEKKMRTLMEPFVQRKL